MFCAMVFQFVVASNAMYVFFVAQPPVFTRQFLDSYDPPLRILSAYGRYGRRQAKFASRVMLYTIHGTPLCTCGTNNCIAFFFLDHSHPKCTRAIAYSLVCCNRTGLRMMWTLCTCLMEPNLWLPVSGGIHTVPYRGMCTIFPLRPKAGSTILFCGRYCSRIIKTRSSRESTSRPANFVVLMGAPLVMI